MGVTFIAPQGVYTAPAKLVSKTITENNTYNAIDDNANGYSSVTVNVEGGGSSWQTVFEGSVTRPEGAADTTITGLSSLTADTIKVTFGGTEYTCEKLEDGSYGALYSHGDYDWSEYPFSIYDDGEMKIATETAGTYTLKIEEQSGGGSSDFSTAEVTVVKTQNFDLYFPFCYDDEDIHQTDFIVSDDGTYRAVLYKGGCFGNVTPTGLDEPNIEVTGDIDVDGTDLYIFGDCTITISAGE